MTTMKKMIGSAALGIAVLGGAATIGAGAASAAPGPSPTPHAQQQQNHHQPQRPEAHRPQSSGQNPNWRPGRVFHQGAWRTPVWDAGRHHWGFWLGPIWIPIG